MYLVGTKTDAVHAHHLPNRNQTIASFTPTEITLPHKKLQIVPVSPQILHSEHAPARRWLVGATSTRLAHNLTVMALTLPLPP